MWFPSFCLGTAHAKTKTQAQPTATSACTQMGPLLGLYCIKFAQAMRLLICQPSLQLRTAKCTRNIKSSNFCSHLFLSTSLSLSHPQSLLFFLSRAQINQFAGPIKRKSMASLAAKRPKSSAKWMLFLRRRTSSGPSTTPPKPSICRKAASDRTRRRAPRSPTPPSR